MRFARRKFLRLTVSAVAASTLTKVTNAQAYPARPVHWIIGFPAGGSLDLGGRVMTQWLSERVGQQFIVENRPGAGGNIAAEAVLKAPADGYTLLQVSIADAFGATLYNRYSFDRVRDMAPVAGILRVPGVLVVNPSAPFASVPELVTYAKGNPGKVNVASGGNASAQHIYLELFKMMTGVDVVHVPYRGGGPALIDLLAGHAQVMFDTAPTSMEYIRANRLRPLAVTTTKRLEQLPNIPTMSEFVPGFEASGWQGVCAPAKTPPEIITDLNKEINAGLDEPRMKAQMADWACLPLALSPTQFREHFAAEIEKWAKVIRIANIKAE
jgi:tripartite-type tricarboxylate transporter receptor subunit TctC